MVKRASIDRTFRALSDPTRRGILEQLSHGSARVTDLARPYRMSLPAVSKHLAVLEDVGLVTRKRVGREHVIRANPAPIKEVTDWISLYANVWKGQFDALDAFLAGDNNPRQASD